jgi:simple sugar transport system ATP-binding protein
MSIFERIVCGVDPSPAGMDALCQARQLLMPGGRLVAATVYDPTIAVHAGWRASAVAEELEREGEETRPVLTPLGVRQRPILELRGITKNFPDVVANDAVDFDLFSGEVHALLGENGAGKSTLMNVLYGLYRPDAGEIRLDGARAEISSPRDAIELGVGMVHQHFMLIPVMTVAENIVLAMEPRRGPFLDRESAEKRVAELSRRFGLLVEPDVKIQDLSVGQQQRVEILKALYREAKILILDEPTAVLTPQEAEELFKIIRSLTAEGKAVVFITHKLHEVLEVADRITVLRLGKKVATLPREGTTEEELARLMVGREVLLRVEKTPAEPGASLLTIEDLEVRDDRGLEAVRGVSFSVRAGEIVGIAGVDGNGQTELLEAVTGLRRPRAGRILVDGRDLTGRGARTFLDAGVGHVPEDRQRQGLVLNFTLAENLALRDYRRPPDSRYGWLRPGVLLSRARMLLNEFDVRGGTPTTPASSLSGGNQQKLVVAREIARDPRLLVASQPTRGLDVGATEFVHRRLIQERDEGRAILLVSFTLEEILSLSDRILVLYQGKVVGEYPPTVSKEQLGIVMAGGQARDQIPGEVRRAI